MHLYLLERSSFCCLTISHGISILGFSTGHLSKGAKSGMEGKLVLESENKLEPDPESEMELEAASNLELEWESESDIEKELRVEAE